MSTFFSFFINAVGQIFANGTSLKFKVFKMWFPASSEDRGRARSSRGGGGGSRWRSTPPWPAVGSVYEGRRLDWQPPPPRSMIHTLPIATGTCPRSNNWPAEECRGVVSRERRRRRNDTVRCLELNRRANICPVSIFRRICHLFVFVSVRAPSLWWTHSPFYVTADWIFVLVPLHSSDGAYRIYIYIRWRSCQKKKKMSF